MEPNQIQVVHHKTNARDFFLHLGSMVALYAIVINLTTLLFSVIDKAFPLVGSYRYYNTYVISFPISLIIIVFPIFVLLNWLLEKTYKIDPERRNFGFKKWVSYVTIFIAGLIVVGDLITVLYQFLDGQELTTGFLLKAFVLFIISSVVFYYYLSEIRNKLNSATQGVWLISSTLVIIIVIIIAFSVLGSPRTQMLIRYDQQKIGDLQNISNSVQFYYSTNNVLPEKLSDLTVDHPYISYKDPQTKKSYEYIKGQNLSYELCAEFNKTSEEINGKSSDPFWITTLHDGSENFWDYTSGRNCFKLTAVSSNKVTTPKYVE